MEKPKELIFLTGAGSSVPVNIPDMKSFKTEFVESCKKNQTMREALKVILDYDHRQDLENLLINLYSVTHINDSIEARIILGDLRASLPEYLKISNNKPEPSTLKHLVEKCTSSVKATASRLSTKFEKLEFGLLDFINKRCLAFDRKKAKEIYEPILNLGKELKVNIFTTNYDPIIEEVCRSSDVLRDIYFDGFVYNSTERLEIWDDSLTRFGQKNIDIYKLHGSVTWYRNKDASKIVQLSAKIGFDAEFKNGSKMFHLLIYPASIKDIYSYPFYNLYLYFLDAIRQQDICIVIGHSLRDEYVRSAIENRLRDDNFRLILISPRIDNMQLQKIVSNRNVIYCPFKIEKFVDRLVAFCQAYKADSTMALLDLDAYVKAYVAKEEKRRQKISKKMSRVKQETQPQI